MEVDTPASDTLEYIVRLNEHLNHHDTRKNRSTARPPLSVEGLVHVASEVCDYIDNHNLPILVSTEILSSSGISNGAGSGNLLSAAKSSSVRSLILINEALNNRYKGVQDAFLSLVNDLIACRGDFDGISDLEVKSRLFPKLLWHEINKREIMREIQKIIDSKVVEECSEEYLEHKLPIMTEWLESEVLPLTSILFVADKVKINESVRKLMCLSFATLRGNELFDIVAEFPESSPGVMELREAATVSNSLSAVAKEFRKALERRL